VVLYLKINFSDYLVMHPTGRARLPVFVRSAFKLDLVPAGRPGPLLFFPTTERPSLFLFNEPGGRPGPLFPAGRAGFLFFPEPGGRPGPLCLRNDECFCLVNTKCNFDSMFLIELTNSLIPSANKLFVFGLAILKY